MLQHNISNLLTKNFEIWWILTTSHVTYLPKSSCKLCYKSWSRLAIFLYYISSSCSVFTVHFQHIKAPVFMIQLARWSSSLTEDYGDQVGLNCTVNKWWEGCVSVIYRVGRWTSLQTGQRNYGRRSAIK